MIARPQPISTMYKVTRLPEANFNKKMNRAIPKTAKRLKKEWYLLKSFEKIQLPIIPIPPKTVKAMVTASGESFAT